MIFLAVFCLFLECLGSFFSSGLFSSLRPFVESFPLRMLSPLATAVSSVWEETGGFNSGLENGGREEQFSQVIKFLCTRKPEPGGKGITADSTTTPPSTAGSENRCLVPFLTFVATLLCPPASKEIATKNSVLQLGKFVNISETQIMSIWTKHQLSNCSCI